MINAKVLQTFVERLSSEEQYDEEEGEWRFQSGGSCGVCTDSAQKIADAFGGKVVGYLSESNPLALIGNTYCEGHDFALIMNRFIVDYWAFKVIKVIERPVLDLSIEADHSQARLLYGDDKKWEDVPAIIRNSLH